MSVPEAAKALGLAPATLRAQIRNGKLRATKVGSAVRGEWFVSPEEVERYRKENRR
jgi:excisionase family DNA binding protein